jgi:hypothetical protein
MTRNDLLEIANTVYTNGGATERELVFAQTVAHAAAAEERAKTQDRLDTLHALYEQACRQRDELMDQQRAQVEAMRGRIQ